MNKRRIAIYSRKSKFTGKGDSVENQINMCRNYIEHTINRNEMIYDTEDILLFEDEGYSGGNTNRPQFQNLMKAVKNKEIAVLIVYRLDRITRSISDFAQVLDTLKKYDVKFVSVSENFGDYSPMATAMMYMTSIFAQFEREIIAERIKDNMLELSKSGRWLGGNTPLGFSSEEVIHIDESGKERSSYKLSPIDEETSMVKLIYKKFLEYNSLSAVETYLLKSNIKTKNGKDYSRFSLRNILTNPVYAIADQHTFDYFTDLGCQVYSDTSKYDGIHAIMPFNRSLQQKGRSNRLRPYTEWIISVGLHNGVIPSLDWIKVQHIINDNKDKSYRSSKNTSSLLSSLLICKECGSYMRPKLGRINKEGKQSFYYICELKEKTHGERCNVPNVNGLKVDEMVTSELQKIQSNNSSLMKQLATENTKMSHVESERALEKKQLKEKLETNKISIDNLINKLALIEDPDLTKIILDKVSALKTQRLSLEENLLQLEESVPLSMASEAKRTYITQQLSYFDQEFDSFDILKKRAFLSTLIEKIEWDGNNVTVQLFGPNSYKRMSKLFPESGNSK
ncbi:MAG: recombinase family protein [Cellulosilyticum sp.]|nr:recombinase family protein [Cellulosilyticum sp.]